MNGLGTPIGSHLTPNDPGYVDLTGQYPHDPAKAKALLKEAGVTTPLTLTLTLPPPDYARKGGEIVAAELAEVGIQAKIENVEWAQWLSNVYKDKNYDLTIISHVEPLDIGIYAKPGYYFNYDNADFNAIIARLQFGARYRGLQEGAGRRAAQARRRLRQRVPVPVAQRRDRRRESEGPLEGRADFRQRSRRALLEVRRVAVAADRLGRLDRERTIPLHDWAGAGDDFEAPPVTHVALSDDLMRTFELSAIALLDAYRRRELSPVEVMRDVLERVAAFEPQIHATYLLAPERALQDARASEARWLKGAPIGPLDGVPATVKDNIATRGEPKPVGTAASDLDPQPVDAPPAARLREAGAILFAKTTMPDYGMLSSGLSSFHPLDAQSLEPRPQSRRLVGGRGRGGRRRATGRCISAPTSAARCGCRRAGAACSA